MNESRLDISLYQLPLQRLRNRVTFGTIESESTYPDLLGIQIDSFHDFLQEDVSVSERRFLGLQRAFESNFPIEDNSGVYELSFLEYIVEKPKYSEEECRERELTYAKTLKAKLRLSSKADPTSEDYIEAIDQDVYLGQIPAMTPRGTFIINGAERVIVAQLHRSPGCFFDEAVHPNGTKIFSARIIPFKGSWVEFTTDIHDVMYAYIDRKKKFPVTTLLRALGYSSDEDLLNLFDLTMEISVKRMSEDHLGRRIAADAVDMNTGELIAQRDLILDEELVARLQASTVETSTKTQTTSQSSPRHLPRTRHVHAKTLLRRFTVSSAQAIHQISTRHGACWKSCSLTPSATILELLDATASMKSLT
jgi:DNA-directed RNA polymerase subunit beta